MERLIGNFWIHDPGTGEVSVYERIGRALRPIRAESEELPDRIPHEAQLAIKAKLAEAAVELNKRTPKTARLAQLTQALTLFPAFTELDKQEQERFLERLAQGIPDDWEEKKPETLGLPSVETIEQQVERANQLKLQEIDQLALKETEILRLREQVAKQEAESAAIAAKNEEITNLRNQLAAHEKDAEIQRLKNQLEAERAIREAPPTEPPPADNTDGQTPQVT